MCWVANGLPKERDRARSMKLELLGAEEGKEGEEAEEGEEGQSGQKRKRDEASGKGHGSALLRSSLSSSDPSECSTV